MKCLNPSVEWLPFDTCTDKWAQGKAMRLRSETQVASPITT